MGLTTCSFTCHFSSSASERAKVFYRVVSLHISNIYAKKKGIAKTLILTLRAVLISQEVDLDAGDFNGITWRNRGKDNFSTIDETFMDSILPTPPGTTPLWGPGSIPDSWADVCVFLKPPGPQRFWKVNKHGAFSIPRKSLGLRPTDQSLHHKTWLHLDFVDWSNTWSKQKVHEQRISLKERPAESAYGNPKRRISKNMSDHSLSSQMCATIRTCVLSLSYFDHSLVGISAFFITKRFDDASVPARMMHASLVHFFFVTCFHSDFHVSSHITMHDQPLSVILLMT